MNKIMIVVGARPNFMKAAPLVAAIRRHNRNSLANPVSLCLVHTGQHYDEMMSGAFFDDLDLPAPDLHLAVGSGSHAVQTAEIMRRFEAVLLAQEPDIVVVVGDVNSTLACALVASKIPCDGGRSRPLIAHVEAGLRSFDRDMPEEVNRVLTDHLADLLFVTEESGMQNLLREGIPDSKIHFVGNTMIDSVLASLVKAEQSRILDQLGLRRIPYSLLTLHRPANVDQREMFLNILEGLQDLSNTCPILFPAHPRTGRRIQEFGLEPFFMVPAGTKDTCAAPGIHLLEPLGYLDFLCLMKHAALVITDSGGIQEETTSLGVPCVTVRKNTERPVTVSRGTNVIAGTEEDTIRKAIAKQLLTNQPATLPEKWDGRAGERIIAKLLAMPGRAEEEDLVAPLSNATST